MNKKVFEYFMTPISILGIGCLEQFISYIKPMKLKKALLVSDKVLVETKLIEPLTIILKKAGIFFVIYDNVSPNPTIAQVDYGLKLYRDNGCDFLISFGGGSPHDCGKAIALLATNGGDIKNYAGLNKSAKPSAPLITINTTAGTGSEITRFCVITDEEKHIKMTITDWHLTPIIAVNDAELMVGMPPGLTAATGIDALTHAIEAYVSTNATPITDCKALKAIELIAKYLQPAVKNGTNLEAREMMIYAAYLAGIAFNNASLGYVHALAHQLGGFYNLPHGLANAIMLPAVADFNRYCVPQKYADIARAMGKDITGQSVESISQLTVFSIKEFIKALGIPQQLSQIRGFNENDIPILAGNALKDVCCLTNPRQGTQQDIEGIFRSVI